MEISTVTLNYITELVNQIISTGKIASRYHVHGFLFQGRKSSNVFEIFLLAER